MMRIEQDEREDRGELIPQPRRRGWRSRTMCAAIGVAAVLGTGLIAPAAASADPYPSADVQVGANIRACPYVATCPPEGTVGRDSYLHDTQRSWVQCYEDGDWATGNYSSNRWFKVYVTATGSSWAFWGFVHASYVYNQPAVPAC